MAYPFPVLAPDLLELARWMSGYYAAPLDEIIEAMIPAAVRRGAGLKQEKLLAVAQKLTPEEVAQLAKRAPQQAKLYAFLAQQFRPQAKALVLRRLGVTAATAAALVRRGALREESPPGGAGSLCRRMGERRTGLDPAARAQSRPAGGRGGPGGGAWPRESSESGCCTG